MQRQHQRFVADSLDAACNLGCVVAKRSQALAGALLGAGNDVRKVTLGETRLPTELDRFNMSQNVRFERIFDAFDGIAQLISRGSGPGRNQEHERGKFSR